jgi:hypothetical protein
MSIPNTIYEYLIKLPPGDGDFTPIDLDQMASDLHKTRNSLYAHLRTLEQKGRAEWVRHSRPGGGRPEIVGFRNLSAKGNNNVKMPEVAAEAAPVEKPYIVSSRKMVPTPELDKLGEARSAMAAFVQQFPGLIDEARLTASLRIDPSKAEVFANEGLNLLERNAWLEQRYRDAIRRATDAERELGYLRTKNNEQVRTAMRDAGVLVEHGER